MNRLCFLKSLAVAPFGLLAINLDEQTPVKKGNNKSLIQLINDFQNKELRDNLVKLAKDTPYKTLELSEDLRRRIFGVSKNGLI